MSRTTVVLDAANDARLARDLTAGGAFVVGYDLKISQECELVVHNGGVELRLMARVVYVDPVDPSRGVGLELVGFDASVRDQLSALIDSGLGRPMPSGSVPPDTHALGSSPGVPRPTGTTRELISSSSIEAAKRRAGRASVLRPAGSNPDLRVDDLDEVPPTIGRIRLRKSTPPATEPIDLGAAPPEPEVELELGLALGSERQVGPVEAKADEPDDERDPVARTAMERLRGLTLAAQVKLAHSGDVNERIILERLYGKNVWEPLLHNSRLTTPEVARIAKMGTLPRILIETIVSNHGWLASADVRRALLLNPRLAPDQVVKVLRLLPKPELRLIPTQLALPMSVRETAKRLLRGEVL